jgi:glycosyltransferase involved in cell wall biosynthesis
VNSPVTWSGIPYHFMLEARRQRLVDEGLCLATDDRHWKVRRIAWNAARLLAFECPGGYQYSTAFLERLYDPVRAKIAGAAVINCFQLYPPSVVENQSIEKWFYIDMTLRQLFEYYGVGNSIGTSIVRDSLQRERNGYALAEGVIVHSRWAAQSVILDCGIAPDRVHVVIPGASLDPEQYATWELGQTRTMNVSAAQPLRLVFVGKYWKRKGLDRLLGAFDLARQAGLNAILRILGCDQDSLPATYRQISGVEWVGFIDKRKEPQRFLRLVAECDVGCLLSRVEAGGIALREYQALGLVTIGPDTGGAPEHMIEGASIALSPVATLEGIANVLLELDRNKDKFHRLRTHAWNMRRQALWENSVTQMLSFLPSRTANSPEVVAG